MDIGWQNLCTGLEVLPSCLACGGGRAEGTPMANIYSESATG